MKAQAPQKMSYQAVIREANNSLLSLKNISMRISILRGDFESSAVYIESQNGKTNINGLVSLQIGTGTILYGNFSKIDWSKGPYYIFTETDPDGGFDYRLNGKSELLSVPFALFAANSSSSIDTTSLHNRIIDLQFQAEENKKNNKKNLDSIIDNAKDIKKNLDSIHVITSDIHVIIDSVKENAAQSEINILGIKENATQIHIALDSIIANSVKIKNNVDTLNTKIDILDLIAILSSYQRVGKILNAFTVDTVDSIDIKSNGNLHSSKNIALSGNIESLGANSSIGTIEKPFKDLYISSNSLYIASDLVGQNIPPTILSNLNGNLQISSGGFKLMGANASFIAPKFEGRLIGNANTATKLDTARKINGVAFDGTKDITIATSTNSNLTGIVTSIDNVTSIAGGTITNSMLANTAVAYLSGTNTGDQILPTLVSLGAVATNVAITSATKTKLTFDSKGLVTAGTDATTADIAVSTNKNYVTDVQAGVISNTSGINTGDESTITIKTKLSITTLTGSNTGDQVLPTLASLGGVASNTAITGATKTKITYDSKGLVTMGANATTADIAASINKNYVSDLQALTLSNTSGTNTGDQIVPTLVSLRRSENETDPYFDERGILSKLTLSSNTIEEQKEEIDLSKTIHKLIGKELTNYFLRDGFEGQVIYILPFGDETNLSNIKITVINGTYWRSSLLETSDGIRPIIWTPFSVTTPANTMAMAIFTENRWFLTGGTSTIQR